VGSEKGKFAALVEGGENGFRTTHTRRKGEVRPFEWGQPLGKEEGAADYQFHDMEKMDNKSRVFPWQKQRSDGMLVNGN